MIKSPNTTVVEIILFIFVAIVLATSVTSAKDGMYVFQLALLSVGATLFGIFMAKGATKKQCLQQLAELTFSKQDLGSAKGLPSAVLRTKELTFHFVGGRVNSISENAKSNESGKTESVTVDRDQLVEA